MVHAHDSDDVEEASCTEGTDGGVISDAIYLVFGRQLLCQAARQLLLVAELLWDVSFCEGGYGGVGQAYLAGDRTLSVTLIAGAHTAPTTRITTSRTRFGKVVFFASAAWNSEASPQSPGAAETC